MLLGLVMEISLAEAYSMQTERHETQLSGLALPIARNNTGNRQLQLKLRQELQYSL